MSSHIHFCDLVIVKIQFKELTAQNLSKFWNIIATEINLCEKLQLLRGLAHEVIVKDFVVFGF